MDRDELKRQIEKDTKCDKNKLIELFTTINEIKLSMLNGNSKYDEDMYCNLDLTQQILNELLWYKHKLTVVVVLTKDDKAQYCINH